MSRDLPETNCCLNLNALAGDRTGKGGIFMAKMRKLKVHLLTEERFKPFGTLISALNREPDFRAKSGSQLWDMECEIDGTLQLGFTRVNYQPLRFSLMEQHYGVTQGFIPMGGPAAVVGLAPPTPPGILPKPEDVCAFLVDGTKGYILARNTWHSLDRFPVYPPFGDWVTLTDKETTEDLKAAGPEQGGVNLTKTIDFEELYDVVFEFEMQEIEPC